MLIKHAMRIQPSSQSTDRCGGFTYMEMLVVIICVGILVVMAIPMMQKTSGCSSRIKCVSNQKQIGLAFRIFANDHDDRYPFSVEGLRLYDPDPEVTGIGGNTLVFANLETETWHYFQVLSNELASARVVICPMDRTRAKLEAIDFLQSSDSLSDPARRNQAVSYFVGLNADEIRPDGILGGDRNIAGPGALGPAVDESKRALSGPLYLFGPDDASGSKRRWSTHPANKIHENRGNIILADGSVQQVSGQKLEEQLELSRASYGTNAWLFSFPNDPASKAP